MEINEEDRFSDNFKRMHFALHACDDEFFERDALKIGLSMGYEEIT